MMSEKHGLPVHGTSEPEKGRNIPRWVTSRRGQAAYEGDDDRPDLATRIAELLRAASVGIVPDRVYPPEEAAELLGIRSGRRAQTLREIPRALLPDVLVTPGGRIVGYLGRDLLAYIQQCRRTA